MEEGRKGGSNEEQGEKKKRRKRKKKKKKKCRSFTTHQPTNHQSHQFLHHSHPASFHLPRQFYPKGKNLKL
ncbi:hypothetical protein BofuT4_uP034390.1 [Botrytis cinerea T4]|uniref:Uncharacterized protein n=1 Tax=Botryotinia fuckeliana (strain T4) TaxID=999810 RepID=G2Y869_BOTF4|nr:hypothetical protein BofuT4_uP034390.1 [Botrytis cinerea T4]